MYSESMYIQKQIGLSSSKKIRKSANFIYNICFCKNKKKTKKKLFHQQGIFVAFISSMKMLKCSCHVVIQNESDSGQREKKEERN